MTGTVTRSMRRPPRGGSRARRYVLVLVIVVALLVVLDFGARLAAQNIMATKIQQQGLSQKPDVTIDGFPFLTQVASKDFQRVNIAASNLTTGPVTITKVDATATGIRLKSYSSGSGTITNVSGTALISFASLGNTLTQQIGPLGQLLNGAGLNLTAAGPDEVKASLDLVRHLRLGHLAGFPAERQPTAHQPGREQRTAVVSPRIDSESHPADPEAAARADNRPRERHPERSGRRRQRPRCVIRKLAW